jgi:ribosomal protein S18 acetylase RimI-like enzyme
MIETVLEEMMIRPAAPGDFDAIWGILEPVIQAGETYALPRDMTREAALDYWIAPDRQSFVAEPDGEILGTYYLRPNQAGGGAHVANCGYVTHPAANGRGIARKMCEHSLRHARALGYRAMQFNFVLESNARAVALWRSLGFETIGRVPEGFLHPRAGYVDALVLFRRL